MTANGIFQILLFFGLVLLAVKPLGSYMARVFSGERTFLDRIVGPVERLIYRLCGIDPGKEQHWTIYTVAMLLFSLIGMLLLFAMQRLQHLLPFNPQGLGPISPDLSFNTAVSFATNTNWQSYPGESTLGYLVQMMGLTVQNFLSAATGIAIAVALIRGFARHSATTLGNFWVDLVRAILYILLPISLVVALALVWQGVPQNLNSYTTAATLEGATQTIAQGPVASQEAIKMIGTNGGGFFNANSAHPYENPTPLTNLIEMWSIFLIGAGLTYTFGTMVRDTRQGWTLFAAMSLLWGIPYLFIKIAVDDGVPPAFVAWARVVLAAAVLVPLAWRAGTLRSVRGRWRWLLVYAVIEISLPFPLIAFGETHVSSSTTAIATESRTCSWRRWRAAWR